MHQTDSAPRRDCMRSGRSEGRQAGSFTLKEDSRKAIVKGRR